MPRAVRLAGLTLLLKRCLNYAFIRTEQMEIDTITMEVSINRERTRITSAYKPPSRKLLKEDLLEGSAPKVIIADFNCKSPQLNCTGQNTDGAKLIRFTEDPTCLPLNLGIPQILDIVVLKRV